jgi:hypothetical protein
VAEVQVHWRPSGGRGEYEHVPQDLLLGRNILINPISVAGATLATDVWGRIKDGKPRLRREDPNNRTILNVAPLIAALALLPDPMREDKGELVLPLRDKGYVIRTVTFGVEQITNNRAVCTPHRLRILHDSNVIDLTDRLLRVASLLNTPGLPPQVQSDVTQYKSIVNGGTPLVALRVVASRLAKWFDEQPELNGLLEAPSDNFITEPTADEPEAIALSNLSVDETNKRLVSHYRIDRSRKIRAAKVDLFTKQHGSVFCENCSFSFGAKYGQRGQSFIEVHHVQPLAALLPNVVTKLSDLMLLCANCHRIVHRKPLLSPEGLREITVM